MAFVQDYAKRVGWTPFRTFGGVKYTLFGAFMTKKAATSRANKVKKAGKARLLMDRKKKYKYAVYGA